MERDKMLVKFVGKQKNHLVDWCIFKEAEKEFLIGRVLSMRNSYEKKSVVRQSDFKNTEKKIMAIEASVHGILLKIRMVISLVF